MLEGLGKMGEEGQGMNAPQPYRGVWPQNVSRLAKYAVRFVDGDWKVTVSFETEEGPRYLAVQGASADLADRVNAIKTAVHSQLDGAFYVNEYRHILVPVIDSGLSGTASLFYCAGRLEDDLLFEFDGKLLTGRPERPDGTPLNNGEHWVGPRPGIPYVLSPGGADIYYETPVLTDDHPPTVRPSVTRRVLLSKVLQNKCMASEPAKVRYVLGHQGGRFYVNEYAAMFTPVGEGDGSGLDYVYCGQIDKRVWFPEPTLDG
jgi:hypothetical protein